MANTPDQATGQELQQFLEGWAKAELAGDPGYLAGVLADDYLAVGPRGFMLTKEDWVQRYASGDLRNEAFSFVTNKVRLFGDTAIVTGQQNQTTYYRGHGSPGEFRATLVLIRQPDGWKLVSLQLSPIMPPPGAPRPPGPSGD